MNKQPVFARLSRYSPSHRFRQNLLVLVFCLQPVVLTASAIATKSRVDCSAVKSRILKTSVHYCVLLPPSYDSFEPPRKGAKEEVKKVISREKIRRFPVLYFLHGLGDNEQSLINTGAWDLIDNLREQGKIEEFLIVTPRGRQSFYINSHNGKVRYGDFFVREFIPAIETKYRVKSERRARGITGMSMGGYGALRLAFGNPQLFGSVSAHSPALVSKFPPGLNSAVDSGSPLAGLLGNVFGRPIDMAFWQENDPLELAKKNASQLQGTKIYFDCGDDDEYGFEKGAQALDAELKRLKLSHEFHIYPGNHSLIYMLKHLGASLQFHSRAFSPVH